MTDQLREALHDLADHAEVPRGSGPPARDLWTRGRRARRRRVAASVLVAGAVLGLVGAVVPLVGEQLRTTPVPASYDEADLAVPDHIWAPSSWAPEVSEGDRLGPLALVAAAERRAPWLVTADDEWYGVSAADQSYVWLVLPGRDRDAGEVALSPDGRRVGYFLAGEVPGPRAQSATVGYAVYDTVTGRVSRRTVETERGLAPQGLAWSPDSRRLVASYGQYRRQTGSSAPGVADSWNPATDTVVRLAAGSFWTVAGLAPDGVTTWSDGRRPMIVDPHTGTVRTLSISPAQRASIGRGLVPDHTYVNPSGAAIVLRGALPLGPRSSTSGLHAGRITVDGAVTDLRLLGERWQLNRVLGWTGEHKVLAEAHPRGDYGLRYVTYDVRTGDVSVAIRHTDPPDRWIQALFAQDLLLRPLTDGSAPVSHWHPWSGAGVVLAPAAVLLALVAVRRTRSRREERVLAAGSDS